MDALTSSCSWEGPTKAKCLNSKVKVSGTGYQVTQCATSMAIFIIVVMYVVYELYDL